MIGCAVLHKFRCNLPCSPQTVRDVHFTRNYWESSGQDDGAHFYPNFERCQPLHIMLHTFIRDLGLSGFPLSAMGEDYT